MILLRIPFYILFTAIFWTLSTQFGMFIYDLNNEFPLFKFFFTILYACFVFVCPIIICCWFEADYRERIIIDIEYLFYVIKKYSAKFFKKG
jgi:hypothetical protein